LCRQSLVLLGFLLLLIVLIGALWNFIYINNATREMLADKLSQISRPALYVSQLRISELLQKLELLRSEVLNSNSLTFLVFILSFTLIGLWSYVLTKTYKLTIKNVIFIKALKLFSASWNNQNLLNSTSLSIRNLSTMLKYFGDSYALYRVFTSFRDTLAIFYSQLDRIENERYGLSDDMIVLICDNLQAASISAKTTLMIMGKKLLGKKPIAAEIGKKLSPFAEELAKTKKVMDPQELKKARLNLLRPLSLLQEIERNGQDLRIWNALLKTLPSLFKDLDKLLDNNSELNKRMSAALGDARELFNSKLLPLKADLDIMRTCQEFYDTLCENMVRIQNPRLAKDFYDVEKATELD